MSCKHPLKAFYTGEKTKNGKDSLKVVPYAVHHLEKMDDGSFLKVYSDDHFYKGVPILKYVEIPCGKCIGCRLEYSKRWANRCLMEMKLHESNLFLTVTYDDIHIPKKTIYNEKTGEIHDVNVLVKKDLQDFIKRLRKNTGQKFRYFACGEYGDKTKRPHFHLLIFGLKLDDLKFYKRSNLGFNYYNSETLHNSWLDRSVNPPVPKGYIVVANATWETAAYTARYVIKKVDNSLQLFYDTYKGIEKEFVLMSRKPGISYNFLEENFHNLIDYDVMYLESENGPREIYRDAYFNKKAEAFGIDIAPLKEKSKRIAENSTYAKLSQTSLDYLEMLKVEEDNLLAKSKQLLRKEI